MTEKIWQPWPADEKQCPRCGNPAQVYTKGRDGWFYPGDEARCTICGAAGRVVPRGDVVDLEWG